MEWGMIMALPTVIGMLVLVFAQPGKSYQTFGSTAINEPEWNRSVARLSLDRVLFSFSKTCLPVLLYP